MGLFNRKSTKMSVNGNAVAGSTGIQSPRSAKTPGTASFGSVSLPNVSLPPPPDPTVNPAAYLRSIFAVRERSSIVFGKATRNQLAHFDVDMSKFEETARFVVSIIKVICDL